MVSVYEIYICARNTPENVANLPALTDSRVDPDNSTSEKIRHYTQGTLIVVFVLRFCCVGFKGPGSLKGSDITEEIPLTHGGSGLVTDTCSVYAIWR